MLAPSILGAIGDTPLIDLSALVPVGGARLVAKLEASNPTGSMKDRMALAMIEGAEREGVLEPGQPVVEYTGGSTGASLAMVCAVKGHALRIVTFDAVAEEKLASMRALGAALEIIETPEGKVHPGLQPEMEARVQELEEELGAYWTGQMHNPHQLEGYHAMAREILADVPAPDVFVQAVGTGGSAMGTAQGFRDESADVDVVLVEPAESPYLSTGEGGSHNIEGTSVMAQPPLLDDELYDDVATVPEKEAIAMSRRLARDLGVFVGKSSGMNVAAALEIARDLGSDETVVTVLVDSGLKYLAGDVFG